MVVDSKTLTGPWASGTGNTHENSSIFQVELFGILSVVSALALSTSGGDYHGDWVPVIRSVPTTLHAGASYSLTGQRLNGMSQGAFYGDDFQSATNYPLVRITNNATGHVFYARTHDHSSMAVAQQTDSTTQFDVPAGIETGPSRLEVVTNGIPSHAVGVLVLP